MCTRAIPIRPCGQEGARSRFTTDDSTAVEIHLGVSDPLAAAEVLPTERRSADGVRTASHHCSRGWIACQLMMARGASAENLSLLFRSVGNFRWSSDQHASGSQEGAVPTWVEPGRASDRHFRASFFFLMPLRAVQTGAIALTVALRRPNLKRASLFFWAPCAGVSSQ